MKKVLKISGLIVVILIIALIAIPIIYKDKIIGIVKTEINKNINAKVDFTDMDIGIFRSFPNLNLSIDNLSVVGTGIFKKDTLISSKNLNCSLDIMSLIRGDQIKINAVNINDASIKLLALKDGSVNWDIAKADSSASTSSSDSKFKVALKKYTINNTNIDYEDESMPFKIILDNLNHEGNGDFTQDLFLLNTKTSIESIDMWNEGVKYLHRTNGNLIADLEIDMLNSKYTFKENSLKLNELLLNFDGFIAMPKEDIDLDIKFNCPQNEFKYFMSMIPGVYATEFKDVAASGSLKFDGFVKGKYNEKSMPGFGINLNIDNGKFKYPSMPVALNNVAVKLLVNNRDGKPDNTVIDLTKLHAEIGSDAFDARLSVRTPVSDPNLDGMLKGKINFENISKFIPLEKGSTIKGKLDADLSIKGRMSALEKKLYELFYFNGSLAIENFEYSTATTSQPYELNYCSLNFNPQQVKLNSLKAKYKSSDINANGTIDNLLSYYFKNEKLDANFNLESNKINMEDFMEPSSGEMKVDTTKLNIVEVPSNLNIRLNSSIKSLKYDNVLLSNLNGVLKINDQTIDLSNISFSTLQGQAKMNGYYSTKVRNEAAISYDLQLTDFDIQSTSKTFNTVKKLAPITEKANGKFSAQFNINGKLDEHLNPVFSTLNGGGILNTKSVTINNFTPFIKLADALKLDQFKQLSLSNLNIKFEFKNGRVFTEPFEVNLSGIPAIASGSTGFDQSLDYNLAMNIPTSKIPSAATNVLNGLIKTANDKGAKLSLGDQVKVNAKIVGTVSNPQIKTDIKETANNAINSVKDAVKSEFDNKKKELENEAERLKKEATDKAKSEVDRIKKEAEEKAKKEKEKLKKEAEKKAKDALNGIFGPKK